MTFCHSFSGLDAPDLINPPYQSCEALGGVVCFLSYLWQFVG